MLSNLKQTTKHMQEFHSGSLEFLCAKANSRKVVEGRRISGHTHQEYDKICQEAVVAAAAVR
jgi:hypothetical protein